MSYRGCIHFPFSTSSFARSTLYRILKLRIVEMDRSLRSVPLGRGCRYQAASRRQEAFGRDWRGTGGTCPACACWQFRFDPAGNTEGCLADIEIAEDPGAAEREEHHNGGALEGDA